MPSKQHKLPKPSEVFSRRLREVRERQGLSQQDVAERLHAIGIGLDRVAVAKLEADPPQRGLSLDESLGICAVLGVSPRVMLFPAAPSARVGVGSVSIAAGDGRRWLDGERPLRPEDERPFVAEKAEEDWRLAREPDWETLLSRVRRTRDAILREEHGAPLLLEEMTAAVTRASIAALRRRLNEEED